MRVQVELFLHLRRYALPGEGPQEIELSDGATVGELVTRLGIPAGVQKVVLVDGRLRALDAPLREGETVTVFPPLEGG